VQTGLDELARALAQTVNAYESHTLKGAHEPVELHPHDDVRACSDNNIHDPWRDVIKRWPGYDARASARTGDNRAGGDGKLKAGAEVAVVSSDGREILVRYVATDHRWVVDEPANRDSQT
jgi:hypothetical protein